jgi:hypothetical protein
MRTIGARLLVFRIVECINADRHRWEAIRDMEDAYPSFVRLVGPEEDIVDLHAGLPGECYVPLTARRDRA